MRSMQKLIDWPASGRRAIHGIFTDIDDTLTTDGTITPDALQALGALRAAGLVVIPITGRPVGWCANFMQGSAPWPVHAMVAENGALALLPGTDANGVAQPEKIYCEDAATRGRNTLRMQQVAARIVREVRGATVTRDLGGRETDLAIDYNEHDLLDPERVAQVLAIMHAEGMHTSVSSIHIHGCYGQHTKWTGAQWIVRQLLGRNLLDELDRWVFVGDSGNDETMFEHFVHSAGVANIARFAPAMRHLPRYVTPAERGAGFAQVATAILQARQAA